MLEIATLGMVYAIANCCHHRDKKCETKIEQKLLRKAIRTKEIKEKKGDKEETRVLVQPDPPAAN